MKGLCDCCRRTDDDDAYEYCPTFDGVLCILCLQKHMINTRDRLLLIKTHCTEGSKYPLLVDSEIFTVERLAYIIDLKKGLSNVHKSCTYKIVYNNISN